MGEQIAQTRLLTDLAQDTFEFQVMVLESHHFHASRAFKSFRLLLLRSVQRWLGLLLLLVKALIQVLEVLFFGLDQKFRLRLERPLVLHSEFVSVVSCGQDFLNDR